MDPLDLNNTSETHPLFPSGDWEGFYTYDQGPGAERFMMYFSLHFAKNEVSGGGSDNIGPFVWKGIYDTQGLWCKMTKYYATHTVFYDGHVDENGIWGNWEIPPRLSGGFHLWPKKHEEKAQMEVVDSLMLESLVKVPNPVPA